MGEFEGKVALITGGGSGIGRASAVAFAREGAHVVVADINGEGAEETVRLVEADGGAASAVRIELTDSTAVAELMRGIAAAHGRLDFAHNNAGINDAPSLLAELSDERWDRMIAINLTSVFYCLREELPLMVAGGGGAIVNTSSGAGVFASANIAHYAAAKHGVIGLTRSAAIEYGEHGVRINAVCPGLVDTPMRARSLAFDPEQAQRTLAFSGGRVNPPDADRGHRRLALPRGSLQRQRPGAARRRQVRAGAAPRQPAALGPARSADGRVAPPRAAPGSRGYAPSASLPSNWRSTCTCP